MYTHLVKIYSFILLNLSIVGAHYYVAKFNISGGMITPEDPAIIYKNELIFSFFYLLICTLITRKYKILPILVKITQWIIFARLMFRIVDCLFILNYGNHFTSLVYTDIDLESTLHFLTFSSWIQLILAGVGGVYLFKGIGKSVLYVFRVPDLNTKTLSLSFFIAFLTVLALAPGRKRMGDYLKKYTTEAIVINEHIDHFFPINSYYELPEHLKSKFTSFGLPTDSGFVQIKDRMFSSPETPFQLSVEKPNMFMYLLESSTQKLTSYYNKNYPNLTPNIDRFLNDSNTVVFPNAINSGEPTLNSLLGYLFSMQSVISHDDVRENRVVFNDGFFSVASVLKKNGYNCYYITGITKNFTQTGRIFGSSDFEVYDIENVKEALKEEPRAWGYSDHQLARYYQYFVQHIAKEPYFIVATSIEGHKPYSTYSDSKRYGDGSKPILNANHSTDHAFGTFYSFMEETNRLNTSLFIVGADHPPHPTASYLSVLDDNQKEHPSYHEKIPFGIRFPTQQSHKIINEPFVTIDFSPTLLHILGLNSPHLFEGKSHFERKGTELLFFTKAYDINYYNQVLGTDYQKNMIDQLKLSEDDVSAYFKWKRSTFLSQYLYKANEIKQRYYE